MKFFFFHSQITVQTILRRDHPDLVDESLEHDFYFAHRLDFATSGILCLPLNKIACTAFSRSLENRECSKYYIALVHNSVEPEERTIIMPIGQDVRFLTTNNKMCTPITNLSNCRQPREAITHMIVLERGFFYDELTTKVMMKPITGRRHQLRLHCAEIGHGILGDCTYGNRKRERVYSRMFLHSFKLIAPNPIETFNVETEDIFHQVSGWTSVFTINTLAEGIEKLDQMMP